MKKKFKETKFAKWVERHSADIISVATGMAVGAVFGTATVKLMRREFNRGWWNGREVEKSVLIEAFASTEEGKEMLLNATDGDGLKIFSEKDLDKFTKQATRFKEYEKTHNLASTIRIDRADLLYVPRAKAKRDDN